MGRRKRKNGMRIDATTTHLLQLLRNGGGSLATLQITLISGGVTLWKHKRKQLRSGRGGTGEKATLADATPELSLPANSALPPYHKSFKKKLYGLCNWMRTVVRILLRLEHCASSGRGGGTVTMVTGMAHKQAIHFYQQRIWRSYSAASSSQ
jgi:hypothetical protein